ETIRLFKCGHIEPAFIRFATGNFSATIGNQSVNQRHMSAQFTAFDDVCLWCIARHEDVRFQTGPSRVGGKRSASIARARNSQLDCSEMFCHGHGNAHPASLETLRWI